MNKTELDEILNLHKLWLHNDPSGRRASLPDANLWNANLWNAILSNANLSNANLWNAILSDANLSNADLEGADLRNAILSGAILSGADLSGAILSGAILSGATFNKETVFPKGFDPIARGMKLVEEKVPEAPSPTENKVEVVVVAAVPAAPKTLHEELSEVLAKRGFDLVSLKIQPSKSRANEG